MDFPIPKFKSDTETQQWLEILADIYTYLCNTDERIRSALVETAHVPSHWNVGHHGDVVFSILTPPLIAALSVIF